MQTITTQHGTVTRPKSGATTYHRDGSVTLYNIYTQTWERLHFVSDQVLASLPDDERERVLRHTRGDA